MVLWGAPSVVVFDGRDWITVCNCADRNIGALVNPSLKFPFLAFHSDVGIGGELRFVSRPLSTVSRLHWDPFRSYGRCVQATSRVRVGDTVAPFRYVSWKVRKV